MVWLRRNKQDKAQNAEVNLLELDEAATSRKMLDVGELNIPLLIEDQIDIFVDNEKLYSNCVEGMIAGKFLKLPQQEEAGAE